MLRFLRANWIWIVAPIAVIAILCFVIAWLTTSDPLAPMQYPF